MGSLDSTEPGRTGVTLYRLSSGGAATPPFHDSLQGGTPLTTGPFISPDDPRLTQEVAAVDEWCPVDQSGPIILIANRFKFLKEFTQQAVLGLWGFDHAETGRRLASCGIRGSVFKVCKQGKRAHAHRHTCHCWICDFCGQPKNLLHAWIRRRCIEVRSDAQRGIEIIAPLGSSGIVSRMALWFKYRGIDSVRRREVTAQPDARRTRIVLHTAKVPYAEALAYLRRITRNAPGYSIRIHDEATPLTLLLWMFSSTEAVLGYCGETRARMYDQYYKKRLLETCGRFYRLADASQLIEEDGQAPATCNCGSCDGVMITIPHDQRTVDSVENIESQYDHVDWTNTYSPFQVKRNGGVTFNSRRSSMSMPTATASPPS
jgi:hypothetical protein